MKKPTDSPEEKQPKQPGVGKRYLKARQVVQLLRKRTGRLFLPLVCLALVFPSVAIIQHLFVQAQLYRTTREELGWQAAQVAGEIAYKDKWDLKGYRQAYIAVPSSIIVTKDGLIVDIEGFIPGVLGKIELPDEAIYSRPQTLTTAVGETWRLFGKQVTGGFVIVGICSPENETNPDTKLLANAAKFGSTLEEATSIGSREIDYLVDYAVVSSTGEIKFAWGGVPLRTNPRDLPTPSDHIAPLVSNGKSYLLYCERLLDIRGQHVGTIIVPKDMGVQQNALQAQDTFNWWVAGIAALFALTAVLWLIVPEFLSKATKRITIEEALQIGESKTIEFKSTFLWDLYQNKRNEERQLDVLKSIAGFLNTEGGTLFIGVTEEGTTTRIRGLAEDLKEMGGSKDRLQLALQNLITDRIGSQYSPFITSSLGESGVHCFWVVSVEQSPEPAFVRWKPKTEARERKIFYVREGPKTSDLDTESAVQYIKNKWR